MTDLIDFSALSRLIPEAIVLLIVLYYMDKRDRKFVDALDKITSAQRRTAVAAEKLDEHLTHLNSSHKNAWQKQSLMMEKTLQAVQKLKAG